MNTEDDMFWSSSYCGHVDSPLYHEPSNLQSEVAENTTTKAAVGVSTNMLASCKNQLLHFDESDLEISGPPSVFQWCDLTRPFARERPQQSSYESTTSESGWTRYLEQSHSENLLKINDTGCRDVRRYSTATTYDRDLSEQVVDDDSSMASDASSGPEHPPSYHGSQGIPQSKCASVERIQASTEECRLNYIGDARNSNSCESVSDGSPEVNSRKAKRPKRNSRKQTHSAENVNGAWPELISDVQIEPVNAGDESSSEGHEQPHVLDHVVESDEEWTNIYRRLEILEQLIPNVEELDKEGMLEVAFIYVKSLEQKIKVVALQSPDFLTSVLRGGPSNGRKESALYRKGLCILPLSFLTKGTIR